MKEPVIHEAKDGELSPCPFCGSSAAFEHDAEGNLATWRVFCRDMADNPCPIGYANTIGYPRRIEAAAAWNAPHLRI